ncbi:signal peptide containing protein [Theileria equi strain WA]|uniref:Signal peptide containing protein n=1 Tax=Theileria equi strain WA TaxID=1537102 RepID=L1LBP5_THEEQ|nr:signal peptide containing protein [Theileria equi strain WA]EKX72694.1 signal peptide containing protein [Theileria equi strain WA]|eukprot:XP_004832146.1 signal peptide containing protein [Theileria equi strain WA]
MKILVVLWTVSLVRLCSAGCWGKSKTKDDDNGPYGGSKENLRSAPSKPVVPQLTGQPTITTPITLDLAKPDETKVNVYKEEEDGVKFEDYSPKNAFHISSVMDGGVTLWKAEGANEKSTFVQSHTKGSTLITIGIKNGNNYTGKYFEKNADGWKELKRDEFDKKLNEMSKSGSSPNPSTTPS